MTNVVELPQASLQSVSYVLRCIADEMDRGTYGEVSMGVLVIENKNYKRLVFNGGGADFYRSLALLEIGSALLIQQNVNVVGE